jgi:hypothetical protein
MKLATFCWEPFASPDYMADVIIQKNNKPVVRFCSLHQSGGDPSFIVLHFKEVVRGFDSGKNDAHAPVVEMVLMDGSYTCFVGRLNSGVVKKLCKGVLHPGSLLTVKQHDFIWHWAEDEVVRWKTVMLIHDFDWNNPPGINPNRYPDAVDADSFATDDFQKDRIDLDVVERVECYKFILPLNYKMENTGGWYWTMLHEEGVKCGFWIQSPENRSSMIDGNGWKFAIMMVEIEEISSIAAIAAIFSKPTKLAKRENLTKMAKMAKLAFTYCLYMLKIIKWQKWQKLQN